MDRKSPGELQEHMLGTYYGLRVGLAAIGVAFPLVLLFTGGFLHHVWGVPSISAYYLQPSRFPFFTTRDFFVGGLFAVGACLYLYKGFSTRENVALNLAGVFAALVALLPTGFSALHGPAAVLFFLCIAYVSLRCSRDTLHLLPPAKQARYARLYLWTGVAMVAFPLTALLLSYTSEDLGRTRVFWVEAFAVWAFAAYWITKTFEMRETRAEKRALDAELRREVVPATPPGEADTRLKLSPGAGEVERIVPADWPGTP
ncbi:MAG TPA: hypothetical protein VF263_21540 [Longimicrobiaceae bacterium]